MRDLKKNKQQIWYSLYLGKQEILDDDGNDTGESEIKYSDPLSFRINVSASKGETENQAFGKSLDYDKTLSTHDMTFPIDEYSVLWLSKPTLDEGGVLVVNALGNPITQYEYEVKKVAKSLNVALYAIKQVPVSRG